jgi:hypothetical protein
MYDSVSELQQQHAQNIAQQGTTYTQDYRDIFFSNKTCLIANNELCWTSFEGEITQGISVLFPRHFENFRKLITLFEKLKATSPAAQLQ